MWHGESGGKFPPLLINMGNEKKRKRKEKMKEKRKYKKRKRKIKRKKGLRATKCAGG